MFLPTFQRKALHWIKTGYWREPPSSVTLAEVEAVTTALKKHLSVPQASALPADLSRAMDREINGEPEAPEPEPVATEIIAWRGWKLAEDANAFLDFSTGRPAGRWLLRSVNQETRWDGPSLVANLVPDAVHGCGIYALQKDKMGEALRYLPDVVGEVALSGIVVEGTNGYRAERAMIRSLYLYEGQGGYTEEAKAHIKGDLEARYLSDVVFGWPHGWVRTIQPPHALHLPALSQQASFGLLQMSQLQQSYQTAAMQVFSKP